MSDSMGGAPSPGRIWKSTVLAAVIAALLLFIVIKAPDRSAGRVPAPAAPAEPQSDAPAAAPSPDDELAAIMEGNIRVAEPGVQKSQTAPFKSETFEIAMAPSEEVEFKAHMQPGDTLVYAWTSPQPVYVDMHGEPYSYPDDPAVRYEEVDGAAGGSGSVTSTFPGMNGWYWLNTSEESIVIELKVSGYYEKFEEIYRKAP